MYMYLEYWECALWTRSNRFRSLGCIAVCGSYMVFKILFWFALLLLSGRGNGYDEWPLNSYFTDVVLGVEVLWHNF